jgi:polysaccharide pyruvyl transferase WcaK-like protein
LDSIGCSVSSDQTYPDLAFSLAEQATTPDEAPNERRKVVGLGVMLYAGKLSIDRPSEEISAAYLDSLVVFVKWLLAHNYDIRLLIGDICDTPVIEQFKALLKKRGVTYGAGRIIDDPILSVDNLLSQLAATDYVVATRFHNVLLSLICDKPVISIAFHQKCISLMSDMSLLEYCQDIREICADKLIGQFVELQNNVLKVKALIAQKKKRFRTALDEQYRTIFTGKLFGVTRAEARFSSDTQTDPVSMTKL